LSRFDAIGALAVHAYDRTASPPAWEEEDRMRHLVYVKPGTLEWQDTPAPVLENPGEAIVRPLAVAACDLDVALMRGAASFPGPFPIGHEFVAEVVTLGEDVTGFQRGQRVVVSFQICCGTCDRCRGGLTASCRTAGPGAMYGFRPIGGVHPGALADLVHVPFAQHMMVALPPGVAPAAAASARDNIADAWRAVAPPLAASPGAEILIMASASSIPLYAVMIARALGAARVDVAARNPEVLDQAAALGATPIADEPRRRYAITIDASQDPAGLVTALRSLEPEGTCTSTSIYFEDVALPMLRLYTRGIRFVTGRVNSRAVLPHVLDLIADGRIAPERVTSELVPWDAAPQALTAPSIKPIVIRD
jgi:threonine dehydrogenase-like Zn-dependent dehydrogenase